MKNVILAAGATAIALGGSGSSHSQERDCACLTPVASGNAVAEIIASSGEVIASRPEGFGVASPGTNVSLGSQIMTGHESSASIMVGSCTLNVGANSEVTIASLGTEICLRVSKVEAPVATATAGISNAPLAMFSAISAGAAVASALGGGTDKASP